MTKPRPKLLLASSSKSRRYLLKRLLIDFEICNPNVDETPLANESASALVKRLSIAKTRAGAQQIPAMDWVIGSDQTVDVDQQLLGKPGNRETAIEQLLLCSGQVAQFHTGVCLFNQALEEQHYAFAITQVHFRHLSSEEIIRYLNQEKPFECAGSFRSESLGCCLTTKISSSDPSALVGLPLIKLSYFLREAGFNLP